MGGTHSHGAGQEQALQGQFKTSSRGRWYWCSNPNPFSTTEEKQWTLYSDIESDHIEQAYLSNAEDVTLGTYVINLKNRRQIHSVDNHKQRPIRRVALGAEEQNLRQDRFFSETPKPKVSGNAIVLPHPPFVREWMARNEVILDRFTLDEYGHVISDTNKTLNKIIELAAEGIIKEGEALNKKAEGVLIAKKLRAAAESAFEEVLRCCVYLYTLETFLYKLVNSVLREEKMDKVDTLGPFCYLLNIFLYIGCQGFTTSAFHHKTTVYRGATLPDHVVSEYQNLAEGKVINWNGFISTSKNRKIAEKLGNVLFVIEMGEDKGAGYGADISSLSYYGITEEEVLLPAGSLYSVDKFEIQNQKAIVHLTRKDPLGKNMFKTLYLPKDEQFEGIKSGPPKPLVPNPGQDKPLFDTPRYYKESGCISKDIEATLLSIPAFTYPIPAHLNFANVGRLKEMIYFGDTAFVGEFDAKTSTPMGRGIMIFKDGRLYEGTIVNAAPEGFGRLIMTDGSIYEGEYVNSSPSGKGKYTWGHLTPRCGDCYEGEIVGAKAHGTGTYRFNNGDVYKGGFVNGLKQGKGQMKYADGREYKGEWMNDEKNGQGELTWTSKKKFTGEFKDDLISGKGIMIYQNGTREKGYFEKGILVRAE